MERDQLAAWLEEGLSLEEIGRRVGRDASTVGPWVTKHGLSAAHRERHRAKGALTREQLEPLIAADLTQREVAVAVDRSLATVRHWLQHHGLETTAVARRKNKRGLPAEARFEAACELHGLTVFVRRKGVVSCLRCRADAVREWRRRTKQKLVDLAGGRCALCDYDRCIAALQFHHVDPTQKRFAIGGRGLARAFSELRDELDRCVLLCANCHAEVEAGTVTLPSSVARSPG